MSTLTKRGLPLDLRTSRRSVVILLALTGVAALLRLVALGTTFPTADSVAVAAKLLRSPGFRWMLDEQYGLMINLLIKGFATLFAILGVVVTEFWWKLPVAAFGIMQVPLSYFFLRALGSSDFGALSLAAFMAVLPQHVMQSRYLWGYEVLGILFATVAVWSLLRFLSAPSRRSGLLASLCSGLYLISHGYIIPVAPSVFACLLLASRGGPPLASLRVNLFAALKHWLWLFPLLLAPLYWVAISWALSKQTHLGFFLPDHVRTFIGDTGFLLTSLIVLCLLLGCLFPKLRSRHSLLVGLISGCYLAPLFFGSPPRVTGVFGYIVIGIYFLLCATMLMFDRFYVLRPGLALTAVGITFLATLVGTVDTVFWLGRIESYTGVMHEDPEVGWPARGVVGIDPGSKAAGYLVQRYVPENAKVLAVHRAIEPDNLIFYFNRTETAFYDLTFNESARRIRDRGLADVVICEEEQSFRLDKDETFTRKTSLETNGIVRAVIFTRPGISIPRGTLDIGDLNEKFDREIAPDFKDRLLRSFF